MWLWHHQSAVTPYFRCSLDSKIWMLSKFFVIIALIIKCDEKASHSLWWPFWESLLQIVIGGDSFMNFEIIIAKLDKKLLQNVTCITKRERIYYKVWRVESITKCDSYYNVMRITFYFFLWEENVSFKFILFINVISKELPKDSNNFLRGNKIKLLHPQSFWSKNTLLPQKKIFNTFTLTSLGFFCKYCFLTWSILYELTNL